MMKDKDLFYIAVIGVLAYLLYKKDTKTQITKPADPNANPVGNATNGGLNLPPNMDLPNLTPTPPNGLPTEVALNSSYVQPLIKDENIPTQVYGNVTLPASYGVNITSPSQVQEILEAVQQPAETAPAPVTSTTPTLASQEGVPMETITNVGNLPSPVYTGGSIISEPLTPIKNLDAEIVAESPISMYQPKVADVASEIISKCGSSFSIPNNDKEGSYTNYWYDGKEFYTQTTSPLIRTIAVKISPDAYLEGCKKYQLFQMQYTQKV